MYPVLRKLRFAGLIVDGGTKGRELTEITAFYTAQMGGIKEPSLYKEHYPDALRLTPARNTNRITTAIAYT